MYVFVLETQEHFDLGSLIGDPGERPDFNFVSHHRSKFKILIPVYNITFVDHGFNHVPGFF